MASVTFVPSRIAAGDFVDVPVPGIGDNGKAVTYNHGTGLFVYTGFEASGAVSTHVGLANPHSQYLLASSYTAADVFAKVLTLDGSGSGLDADLLDGNSSAAFATAGHTHNYQPLDDELTAIAGLVSAANTVPSFTGSGTAALLTVGTSANNLVKLDGSAKLPAVDGSQLTNLPGASGVLLADGTVIGATSQQQIFTNGIAITRGITDLGLLNGYFGTAYLPYIYQIDAGVDYGMTYTAYGDTFYGVYQEFVKSRTTSGATNATVQDGDQILVFQGYADDGTSLSIAAQMLWTVDGTPSSGIVPGRIAFYVANTSGSSPECFTIRSSGKVGINNGNPDAQLSTTASSSTNVVLSAQGAASQSADLTQWKNSSSTVLSAITKDGYLAAGQTAATAVVDVVGSSTSRSAMRLRSGTAPTSPNDGDFWYDGSNLKFRLGGTTKTITWT